MNGPQTLQARIGRAGGDLNHGMAVMVRIEPEERSEAERMVGDRPIILCGHEDGMRFLAIWMKPIFDKRR